MNLPLLPNKADMQFHQQEKTTHCSLDLDGLPFWHERARMREMARMQGGHRLRADGWGVCARHQGVFCPDRN